ncbi:hypothetical protein GFY24_11100 [Nocardia sp. SYP-A9097]|uniref:hypothetical protein n=1 Tax=Nocardia sp. SYP-A9097 TaxID=2663237 RepID=UPI00129A0BF6|nr:hypothetical protein [Nocardia sp. SYP-A9097]MRH87985.1 hypothetical protein [Nocardia sp. SYP-A9097]
MTRARAMPVTGRTLGIIADGAVKVLLAGAYTLGARRLGHQLGVEPWLLIACGLSLFLGGGFELGYLRSRPVSTYLRLMVAYDTGWIAVTAAALLLAEQANPAAGELWIGYQTAAPLAFAALLTWIKPGHPTHR